VGGRKRRRGRRARGGVSSPDLGLKTPPKTGCTEFHLPARKGNVVATGRQLRTTKAVRSPVTVTVTVLDCACWGDCPARATGWAMARGGGKRWETEKTPSREELEGRDSCRIPARSTNELSMRTALKRRQ